MITHASLTAAFGSLVINSVLAVLLMQGFAGSAPPPSSDGPTLASKAIYQNTQAAARHARLSIAGDRRELLSIWA